MVLCAGGGRSPAQRPQRQGADQGATRAPIDTRRATLLTTTGGRPRDHRSSIHTFIGQAAMDLAAVQFDGQGAAVERYAAAKARSGDASWTRRVGFVERHHNGNLLIRGVFAGHYVDVDEGEHISKVGGGEGALAGGLLGVLAGPPGIAVGLLAGAVIGSRHGPATDTGPEPEAPPDERPAVL